MEKDKIKIIFFGTAKIGVPSLEALISDKRFQVQALVTQEDKPVGRKQIVTPPPTKIIAEKYKLSVYQPKKLNDIYEQIVSMSPDIIVDIAFAKLVPKKMLELPKHNCINVHASLLPKYRGAACIQAPIINGDSISGITIMQMDEGLDTGPILKQFIVKLDELETAETLHDKLAGTACVNLPDTLCSWFKGEIEAKQQNNNDSTYVKKINKEDGHIDWHLSASRIEKLIRAYKPWPGTFGYIQKDENKIFKIISVEKLPIGKDSYSKGELFLFNDTLAIACGKDALIITEAQIEGKKLMSADEILRGHKDIIGKILL